MSTPPTDPQLLRYVFQRKLDEIAQCRGRATELISLYVSPGKQISDVMGSPKAVPRRVPTSRADDPEERDVGDRVVDGAGPRVQGAARQRRRLLRRQQGDRLGQVRARSAFIVEPPEPLHTYLYRCDSTFFLEPLLSMVHEPDL